MTSKRIFLAIAIALSLGAATPAFAGEGHDHGDAAAAPNANGPQRLPDGSVFLPKPAQRQLGVRTLLTEEAELPRSFELNGKVVIRHLRRRRGGRHRRPPPGQDHGRRTADRAG